MGRRGPKAQPSALKKLGSGRIKNLDEPKFETAIVSCPNWLTGEAKTEWRRVITILSKVPGLLTSVDRSVLASYCQSYARWRQAEHHLEEEGETVTIHGQHGYVAEQVSPWVNISKTYHDSMMKSGREMGFTPSARTGIKLSEPTKPNLGAPNNQASLDPFKPPTSKPPVMRVERKK
jgi:P27 family predicted phage terminase small subunit